MSDLSKPLPSAFRVLSCPNPGHASSQTCFQFPQLTLIRATTCALFGLSGFRKSTGIKRFPTLFTPWFLEFRDYFFAFYDLRTLAKKIGGVGSPLWLTAIHKPLRISNAPAFLPSPHWLRRHAFSRRPLVYIQGFVRPLQKVSRQLAGPVRRATGGKRDRQPLPFPLRLEPAQPLQDMTNLIQLALRKDDQ